MGFLDRLFGREEQQAPAQRPAANGYAAPASPAAPAPAATAQRSDDEIAVERYRYLLRTAPPETIEQVHEEAFTKLTPEQRQLLFQQLSQNAPAGEQPRADDPHSLAQSATRAELRQPGTLERSLGGGGAGGGRGGVGFGGMFASSLLGSVAGYVIGSALVGAFLPSPAEQQADAGAGDGADGSGDAGSGDAGSGDAGASGDAGSGDAGGWGGDAGTVSADGGGWDNGGGFGGGDFGGGDFGGGGDFF